MSSHKPARRQGKIVRYVREDRTCSIIFSSSSLRGDGGAGYILHFVSFESLCLSKKSKILRGARIRRGAPELAGYWGWVRRVSET